MSDERIGMARVGRHLAFRAMAPVAAALALSVSALAAEPVVQFVDVGWSEARSAGLGRIRATRDPVGRVG
jgi:hypothetical protein